MTFLADVMRRHPAWLSRLEKGNFAPVSLVSVGTLMEGDIIDVRDFGIMVEMEGGDEDICYLVLDDIRRDDKGTLSLTGVLADGTVLSITRRGNVPMIRRQVPRYVRRRTI